MAKSKRDSILKQLAVTVIGYEDGDILLLSEMLDDIKLLKGEFKRKKYVIPLLELVEDRINNLLKGGDDEIFTEFISDAIELILSGTKEAIEDFIKPEDEVVKDGCDLPQDFDLTGETFKIFLVEADERMSHAQEIILDLENDLDNKKLIDNLFRVFHTIKGECGFLNLIKLGELTHNMENLLDMIRYNEIENNIDIIDVILEGVDLSNSLLNTLKNASHEDYNSVNINSVVKKIESCIKGVRIPIGQVLQDEGLLDKKQVEMITREQHRSGYTKKFGEIATENNILKEEDIKKTLKKQRQIQVKQDEFVKVSVSQINYLVDMIGELIIAENQIKDEEVEFLHKITKEIQQTAMMLRTVKIKNLLINMKRVVRDAAKKLDKSVQLQLIGEGLEVDRNLVEHLEEPLIHLLRNSVGHGIESREERVKLGKSETGEILIKSERVGNQIRISVRDDGRGLDRDKILEKALNKKLITPEKAKSIKDSEILSLIFLPGFSTSEVVDNVSGRGVGMDIVKNTVNSLRGNIGIKSVIGEYSEFTLEFPLIMAIIDSMIVLVDGINFILPVVNIIETVKFDSRSVHHIESRDSVINLRNEVIPVIDLRNFFNINETERSSIELAIIVEQNKRKYAFIADQIVTQKEVVIKSLGDKINKIQGISAATILKGGVIGYIINIEEVINSHGREKIAANS